MSNDLSRMLANQRRRHLIAQLMTARRWCRQLEDLLCHGTPPTGYGAPLEPPPSDEAEGVLASVRCLLERWRRFAATYAAGELEDVDQVRPISETRRWARLLLDRLEDLVEETVQDASAAEQRSTPGQEAVEFARDAHELLSEARERLKPR